MFIAPFLLFPITIAIVLGILGYKKGWKFGVAAFSAIIVASGLSYGATRLLTRFISRLGFVDDIRWDITRMLRDAGLSDLSWEALFDLSLNRMLSFVLIPVLLTLFYIIICIAWAILFKAMKRTTNSPHKPIGLASGILAAVVAGVFSLFASGANVIGEARRANQIIEIVRPLNISQPDLVYVTEQLPVLLDIYFGTALIAADEVARVAFLTDIINGVVVSAFNINSMLVIRPSQENFKRDANNIKELAWFADGQRLLVSRTDFTNFNRDHINDSIEDLARYLFGFSFSPELARTVLTLVVREVSGNPNFVYPIGIITNDSQSTFAEVLVAIGGLSDFLGGKPFDQMTETERAYTLDAVNLLRNSPLFPTHVFAYLTDVI